MYYPNLTLSVLNINAKTWNKETDDLFDFEATDIVTKDYKVNSGETNQYILSSGKL